MTDKVPDRAQSPNSNSNIFPIDQTTRVHICDGDNLPFCTKHSLGETHNKRAVPDKLGKLALKYRTKLSPLQFYDLINRTRSHYKLNHLSLSSHPAAPLFNHIRNHSASVILDTSLSANQIGRQLRKGAHPIARSKPAFFQADVHNQMTKGHLLVPPLIVVSDLPDLWVIP